MILDVPHNTYDADTIKQKSDVAIVCYVSQLYPTHDKFQSPFWFSRTAPGSTSGALLGSFLGTGPSFKPLEALNNTNRDNVSAPLTHAEMIKNMIQNRVSVSMLAEIIGVTRPTIYSWQEGTDPQADKQNRIELIFDLLSTVDAQRISLLSKVWNRKIDDNLSLFQILTSPSPIAADFKNAFVAAEPLFQKLIARSQTQRRTVSEMVDETLSAETPLLKDWDLMQSVGREIV